ncbi:MAG: hypothetical protein AB1697_04825 [Pseudomonadota bacterium]
MEALTLRQLLDDYGQVARRHDLPPMRLERLVRRVQTCDSWQEALARLAAFTPASGWLQYQSRVLAFEDGTLPTPGPEAGALLEAEAARQDASLHVRRDGMGRWLVIEMRDSETEGEPCLAEDLRLLGAGAAPGDLHYIRYWQADAALGMRQVTARFAGFLAREA